MRDSIKSVLAVLAGVVIFLGVCVLIAFAHAAMEEDPHRVVIGGQEYIRSKEYVGDNKYQIIMIPVKECPCNQSK
jgi:hypothetical protein